jgi:hypothetical protein
MVVFMDSLCPTMHLNLARQLLEFGEAPNLARHILEDDGLHDVIACAFSERGDCRVQIGVGGEHDHTQIRPQPHHAVERVDAAHAGHHDVAQDDVGVPVRKRRQSLLT